MALAARVDSEASNVANVGFHFHLAIDWIDAPLADAGVFVADDGDGWHYRSYTELAGLARRIGGALRANGLRAGDNACIVMPWGIDASQ